MIIIKLNDLEQATAETIGMKRYENDRKANLTNKKIGPQTDEESEKTGMGGEFALFKHFNLYPDFETDASHRPDYDIILPNGMRGDVKTTTYNDGRLLVPPWKKDKQADVYILMIKNGSEYRLAGFMLARDVFKDENITVIRNHDTYAIDQYRLKTYEETCGE